MSRPPAPKRIFGHVLHGASAHPSAEAGILPILRIRSILFSTVSPGVKICYGVAVSGVVPFRCQARNWRGWRNDFAPGGDGPRGIHRALTDSELARLELDNAEGDRT